MGTLKKKNAPAKAKAHFSSSLTHKKYKPVLEKMQEGSQNYMILEFILENGSITPKEAEKKPIYCMRLASRIWDLRQKYGVPIKTETVKKKRGKNVISYASYHID